MTTVHSKATCDLYADRKKGTFRKVPAETRELWITMLRPDEVPELAALGRRLKRLQKLTLMYGDLEDIDFLEFFGSIHTLKCLLARLKSFDGIGLCSKLKGLFLGGSLSSVGNLAFLGRLPRLEQLSLEGPHPSKGLERVEPMSALRVLSLYAPKWGLSILPEICPALDALSISQGSYQSLDFISNLKQLTSLDVAYARKLARFESIGGHAQLRSVKLGYAISGLRTCSQLGCSASIRKLSISTCRELKDVTALSAWSVLREVEFTRCPGIPAGQIEALREAGKIVNGK